MKEFLESKGIQEIHGKPYNPRSQGVVEAYNGTIKNMLLKKYYENPKHFDLYIYLPDEVSTYYVKKHRTYLYAPNYLFNSNVVSLIKKARINIIKSQ